MSCFHYSKCVQQVLVLLKARFSIVDPVKVAVQTKRSSLFRRYASAGASRGSGVSREISKTWGKGQVLTPFTRGNYFARIPQFVICFCGS